MRIKTLIWLEEIVEKLEAKHNVSQDEVRDIIEGRPQFRFVKKGYVAGEHLYVALGRTNAGRYLSVFFVYKRSKAALVVSARDMASKERRHYGKK